MNCANHPDVPVSVFCQFCGKPLCKDCARTIRNIVGCEPCIAARLGATPAPGSYAGNAGDGQNFQYTPSGTVPPSQYPGAPSPGLAGCLGLIPGVGAMYNGQFAKGLVHVLIFAILVSLSDSNGVFGVLVAGWIFYQVFDAYQTAVARRDGLIPPNPLGLNDIGQWFTGQRSPFAQHPGAAGVPPAPPAAGAPPASPYASSFTAAPMPPVPPIPPLPADSYELQEARSGVPTGAVVLIGLGILFLLGNLGVLSSHWLNRSWPLVLVAMGTWILIRRSQSTPPPSGPPANTPSNPPSDPAGGPQ